MISVAAVEDFPQPLRSIRLESLARRPLEGPIRAQGLPAAGTRIQVQEPLLGLLTATPIPAGLSGSRESRSAKLTLRF